MDLYDAAGGLLGADGNPIAITATYDGATLSSIDDFELMGLYNPFSRASWNAFKNGVKVGNHLGAAASVQTPTGGEAYLQTGAGIRPAMAVPEDGEVSYPLADIVPSLRAGKLRLDIIPPPGFVYTNIGSYLELGIFRAFLQWLEDARVSGDPVFTGNVDDLTTISLAHRLHGRNYTITIDGSTFTFSLSATAVGSVRFYTILNLQTGQQPSVQEMEDYLDGAAATFSTTRADYEPPWGEQSVTEDARQVRFPSGDRLVETRKTPNARGVPGWRRNGRTVAIGGAYGNVLGWNDLETVSGQTYRNIPGFEEVYDATLVHISEAAGTNREVRFKLPADYVPTTYGDYRVEVHNGGLGEVRLQGQNGDELIRLYPGQRLQFHMVVRADGTSTLRSVGPIERVLEVAATNLGSLLSVQYAEFTANQWCRFMPWPLVTQRVTPLVHHEDGWSLGSAAWVDAASIFGGTDIAVAGSFTPLKAGPVDIDIDFTATTDTTGDFQSHSVNLLRQRGATATPIVIYNSTQFTLVGTGQVNWDVTYEEAEANEVQADDTLLMVIAYAKASTKTPGTMALPSLHFTAKLAHQITLNYSAT